MTCTDRMHRSDGVKPMGRRDANERGLPTRSPELGAADVLPAGRTVTRLSQRSVSKCASSRLLESIHPDSGLTYAGRCVTADRRSPYTAPPGRSRYPGSSGVRFLTAPRCGGTKTAEVVTTIGVHPRCVLVLHSALLAATSEVFAPLQDPTLDALRCDFTAHTAAATTAHCAPSRTLPHASRGTAAQDLLQG